MIQGLEALFQIRYNDYDNQKRHKELCDTIEKELMVSEIIKSKGIDWRRFKLCETVEQYNEPIILYGLLDVKPYTEEEFKLLKEVLQEHE